MFTWSGEADEDGHLYHLGDQKFSVLQMEVAKCHGRAAVTDEDRQKAFMLWSFVHGLSFLSIDGKLSDGKMQSDLETRLTDIARRVVPEAG